MVVTGVGVSKVMDKHIGVVGQRGNVEHEICNMGEAVFGAAVLSEGVDITAKLYHRV